MNRVKQFNSEVSQLITNNIKMNMPEPKIINASLCNDLPNEFFRDSWTDFKIASGKIIVMQWIKDNGYKICKKSDAKYLLIVGQKNDCDCWIQKETKNYWLIKSIS